MSGGIGAHVKDRFVEPVVSEGRSGARPVNAPLSAVDANAGTSLADALSGLLGVAAELERLKSYIGDWVETRPEEMRELGRWQLLARSKYFRPLAIFACHRSVGGERVTDRLLRAAVGLELIHNVSLIIDDIVDRSRYRRGRLTLHCRFGQLPALMTAGYLAAGAFEIVAADPYAVRALAVLVQRLGIAECYQWRVRRKPLGVEDWRAIAGEDTGSMFETCARLGTMDERLSRYGRLLGMLYHGCDDVSDVRGLAALGGGGDEDVRDGILTLPAAIAIRDPQAAVWFRTPAPGSAARLMKRVTAALPEAEAYLDRLAEEARHEALGACEEPSRLLDLIKTVRELSRS